MLFLLLPAFIACDDLLVEFADTAAAVDDEHHAEHRAQAEYIIVVRAAEADAESKRLAGEGIANQRKAIVQGYQESVAGLQHSTGVDAREVMSVVLMTQYFDAMLGGRELAAPLFTGEVNVNAPLALRVRLLPPLFCSTTEAPEARPVRVPPMV